MKKLFTACLLAGVILMFITTSSYAQIEKWVARYDGPSHGSDTVTDIAVDCLDNVYVTGRSASIGTYGNRDYATIKYDTDGNQLWVARYDGPYNNFDHATAIAADGSGNVYTTGVTVGTIKHDAYSGGYYYGPYMLLLNTTLMVTNYG